MVNGRQCLARKTFWPIAARHRRWQILMVFYIQRCMLGYLPSMRAGIPVCFSINICPLRGRVPQIDFAYITTFGNRSNIIVKRIGKSVLPTPIEF